jgi:hypothetical protein
VKLLSISFELKNRHFICSANYTLFSKSCNSPGTFMRSYASDLEVQAVNHAIRKDVMTLILVITITILKS